MLSLACRRHDRRPRLRRLPVLNYTLDFLQSILIYDDDGFEGSIALNRYHPFRRGRQKEQMWSHGERPGSSKRPLSFQVVEPNPLVERPRMNYSVIQMTLTTASPSVSWPIGLSSPSITSKPAGVPWKVGSIFKTLSRWNNFFFGLKTICNARPVVACVPACDAYRQKYQLPLL